jgi:hypothetical protein
LWLEHLQNDNNEASDRRENVFIVEKHIKVCMLVPPALVEQRKDHKAKAKVGDGVPDDDDPQDPCLQLVLAVVHDYNDDQDNRQPELDQNQTQVDFANVVQKNDVEHNLADLAESQENRHSVLLLVHVLDRVSPGKQHIKQEEAHQDNAEETQEAHHRMGGEPNKSERDCVNVHWVFVVAQHVILDRNPLEHGVDQGVFHDPARNRNVAC